MVASRVSLSPDQAVWVRALARDIVLRSCARHFTLTVPLFTKVYEWVPANLLLGGKPCNGLASHPGGSRNTPSYNNNNEFEQSSPWVDRSHCSRSAKSLIDYRQFSLFFQVPVTRLLRSGMQVQDSVFRLFTNTMIRYILIQGGVSLLRVRGVYVSFIKVAPQSIYEHPRYRA